jgi:hypothetical protein
MISASLCIYANHFFDVLNVDANCREGQAFVVPEVDDTADGTSIRLPFCRCCIVPPINLRLLAIPFFVTDANATASPNDGFFIVRFTFNRPVCPFASCRSNKIVVLPLPALVVAFVGLLLPLWNESTLLCSCNALAVGRTLTSLGRFFST